MAQCATFVPITFAACWKDLVSNVQEEEAREILHRWPEQNYHWPVLAVAAAKYLGVTMHAQLCFWRAGPPLMSMHG